MPSFSKVFELTKNNYMRAALALLLVVTTAAYIYRPLAPSDTEPVVQSQDISEIIRLGANRDRLDYLLVAKPLSDFPRYVFKYKDSPQIHVVKVPSTSQANLEREVLLKNGIPYAIAKDDYLAAHKSVLEDEESRSAMLSDVGLVLARNALGIAMLVFLVFAVRKGIPGMNASASLVKPDSLRGSMDDLIGMEDIKQEVAHLEEMIVNRDLYLSVPSSLDVNEGDDAVITVTSSRTFATNTLIHFNLVPLNGAVPGTDYTAVASPIVLLAGQTSVTLTIPILTDAVSDPNEAVRVDWTGVTAV